MSGENGIFPLPIRSGHLSTSSCDLHRHHSIQGLASMVMLCLLLLASVTLVPQSSLAVNTTFSPPHSYHCKDTDGDGYYNYLVLNASINVTEAGNLIIYGAVYDNTQTHLITEYVKQSNLPTGATVIPIEFNGVDIYNAAIDAPYTIWLIAYDEMWQALDTNTLETNQMNATDFQHKPASLVPPHDDRGLDVDGNSLHDYLVVEVGIGVDVSGHYTVQGGLYDNSGDSWITDASEQAHLSNGNHTLLLFFAGCKIRRKGIDGPYKVKLELKEGQAHLVDEQNHVTNSYLHTDFDGLPAYFSGSSSVVSVDIDGDMLIDYLRVDVDVVVNASGEYTVTGDMFDSSLHIEYVAASENATYLSIGTSTVSLFFPGFRIYESGVDDSFQVDFELLSTNSISLDHYSYVTNRFLHDWFEHAKPVSLCPPHEDKGTDTDSDGYYDYLIVNVSVETSLSGFYRAKGDLHDAAHATVISSVSKFSYLNAGLSTWALSFSGAAIFAAGIDGPYNVSVKIYDSHGNLIELGYHNTGDYEHSDFGNRVPSVPEGRISGQAVDETGSPIPGAFAQLTENGKTVLSTYTDGEGWFHFENVEDGIFEVILEREGYLTLKDQVIVTDGALVSMGSVTLRTQPGSPSNDSDLGYWIVFLVGAIVIAALVCSSVFLARRRKQKKDGKE